MRSEHGPTVDANDDQSDFHKLAGLLRLCGHALTNMLDQRAERINLKPSEDLPADLERIARRIEALAAPHLV